MNVLLLGFDGIVLQLKHYSKKQSQMQAFFD